MIKHKQKVLIPAFQLTEVCDASDPAAVKRKIKNGLDSRSFTYHVRPVIESDTNFKYQYNLFPIPLDQFGKPWGLATNYILSRLESVFTPDLSTYHSLSVDLAAFREWLDLRPKEQLLDFPMHKQKRCTSLYRGFLMQKINLQEIANSTAKRRMSAVISFYRWLIEEELFTPENSPWADKIYNIRSVSNYGSLLTKKSLTTDLSIKGSHAEDALDDRIEDDGKLRPLPMNEQHWIMDSLDLLANPEMRLLILFMILTGARVQTAATIRLHHFSNSKPALYKSISGKGLIYKLKCGPGTGIDTKYNRSGILYITESFYEVLYQYSQSERAILRRQNTSTGDIPNQYLFLTQQGNPYYLAKDEALIFDPTLKKRYRPTGGTIRQFIANQLIPLIQGQHDLKFEFSLHDLRATFGMNHTDIQLNLVESGKSTLSQARNIVRALMWHKSSATTDLYLDYRKRIERNTAAINGLGEHLQSLSDQANKGF